MKRKLCVLLIIVCSILLLVSSHWVWAQSASPLTEDVRVMLTAVANGGQADVLIDQFVRKYQVEEALLDAAMCFASFDSDPATVSTPSPSTRNEPSTSIDRELVLETVSRSPSDYVGRAVCWQGRIFHVVQTGEYTYAQLYYGDTRDAFVVVAKGTLAMRRGDRVNVCGRLAGSYEGKNTFGVSITQPLIQAVPSDIQLVLPTPTPLPPTPPPNPPTPTPPPGPCVSNATYITDVTIPDNAILRPGEKFEKVWQMKNSGTCPWGDGYFLIQVGGEPLSEVREVKLPAAKPGSRVNIKVPMRAPERYGQYEASWQVRAADGQLLGKPVSVRIQVRPREIKMGEQVQIGSWQFRVSEVNRQKDVWQDDRPYWAKGVFALVRLKVLYLGPQKPFENYSTLGNDFQFSVRDEKGRTYDISADGPAGDRARWMLGTMASIWNGTPVGAKDWPVLIAFDVAEDAKELWLDVVPYGDAKQAVSVRLQPCVSKKNQIYNGAFCEAPPMD